jgi:hypothetical protein
MKGRILLAVLVVTATAWLSYSAANRARNATPAVEPGTLVSEGRAPATVGGNRPERLDSLRLAPRPLDVVDPDPKGSIHVCATIDAEDVSDALLARTKFGSRAGLTSFLRGNEVAYSAMRRALIPPFVEATRAIKTCYRGATAEERGVAYLGIRIRASRDRAAVVDASLLRIDAPAESRMHVEDCLEAFKATSLPISVDAPPGQPFAGYDDLYLKEVPVPLGPRSIEHMLSLRNAGTQKRGGDGP